MRFDPHDAGKGHVRVKGKRRIYHVVGPKLSPLFKILAQTSSAPSLALGLQASLTQLRHPHFASRLYPKHTQRRPRPGKKISPILPCAILFLLSCLHPLKGRSCLLSGDGHCRII